MSNETKKCKHCQMDIPKKAKICPNCKKKQKNTLLGVFLLIIGITIFIAAVSGGGEEGTSSQNSNNQEVVSNSEPENIVYITVSVDEMMDLLNDNALKAEKTYQNQYVEITGRLAVIDSDGSYIALFPVRNEFAFTGAQCYIKNDEQLNKVLDMSIGDTVTLKGKVKSIGELMGYSIDIIEIN